MEKYYYPFVNILFDNKMSKKYVTDINEAVINYSNEFKVNRLAICQLTLI